MIPVSPPTGGPFLSTGLHTRPREPGQGGGAWEGGRNPGSDFFASPGGEFILLLHFHINWSRPSKQNLLLFFSQADKC